VRSNPNRIAGLRRQFALLAPNAPDVLGFRDIAVNPTRHRRLLAAAQRLRGRTYLDLGALDPSQLSRDGRHVHSDDDRSWHLVTVDETGQVAACLRYLAHPGDVPFSKLTISHSSLAKSDQWGHKLRSAVEQELIEARRRGASYVEMGGWAIAQELRCTTEALRMIVTAYAFAELSGGALGITNANLESCSASILQRIGGRRLAANGEDLPFYLEDEYQSVKVEILRFDSSGPNPRYQRWMDECQAQLRDVPVICRTPKKHVFSASLVMQSSFAAQPAGEIA